MKKRILKLDYSSDGAIVSDFEAEKFVKDNIGSDKIIKVATELVIEYARLARVRKEVEILELYHCGKFLGVANDAAQIRLWPNGFCDSLSSVISGIITERVNERKKSKARKKMYDAIEQIGEKE